MPKHRPITSVPQVLRNPKHIENPIDADADTIQQLAIAAHKGALTAQQILDYWPSMVLLVLQDMYIIPRNSKAFSEAVKLGNPQTDADLFQDLWRAGDLPNNVRLALIEHPQTPQPIRDSLFFQILAPKKPFPDPSIAAHPLLPSQAMLMIADGDFDPPDDYQMRLKLLGNPNLTDAAALILARDPEPTIRLMLARKQLDTDNYRISDKVREILKQDPDHQVRGELMHYQTTQERRMRAKKPKQNPYKPLAQTSSDELQDLFERAARGPDADLLEAEDLLQHWDKMGLVVTEDPTFTARNQHVFLRAIAHADASNTDFLDDMAFVFPVAVSKNRHITPTTLSILANSPQVEVRRNIVHFNNLPVNILTALQNDPDKRVRAYANYTAYQGKLPPNLQREYDEAKEEEWAETMAFTSIKNRHNWGLDAKAFLQNPHTIPPKHNPSLKKHRPQEYIENPKKARAGTINKLAVTAQNSTLTAKQILDYWPSMDMLVLQYPDLIHRNAKAFEEAVRLGDPSEDAELFNDLVSAGALPVNVTLALIEHPYLSQNHAVHLLRKLTQEFIADPDKPVSLNVYHKVINHRLLSADMQMLLTQSDKVGILDTLARRSDLTEEAFEALAAIPEKYIQNVLARRPDLPEEAARRLIENSSDVMVRKLLAKHSSIPSVWEILKDDENLDIATGLLDNFRVPKEIKEYIYTQRLGMAGNWSHKRNPRKDQTS